MNKKLKFVIIALFALFFMPIQSFANDPGSCGLPSLAVSNKTVNILVNFLTSMPTYTLGVTSGTSGCGGIVLIESEREYYVSSTWDELSENAAQGGGVHLDTLATLMGCGEAKQAFHSMTQAKFDSLFGDLLEPKELILRLKNEIKKDPSLNAVCTQPIG